MADRATELTVGLFVEERVLSDALTAWFARKGPARVQVTPGPAPAITIADERLLAPAAASLPGGIRGTVAILDSNIVRRPAVPALGLVAVTDPPEVLVAAIQAVSSGTRSVSASSATDSSPEQHSFLAC
jgi:hypothetical protein